MKSYGEHRGHEDRRREPGPLQGRVPRLLRRAVRRSYAEEKDLDKRAAMIRKHLIGSQPRRHAGLPAACATRTGRRPAADPFRDGCRQPQAAGRLQPHELDPARPLLHRARAGGERSARRRRRGDGRDRAHDRGRAGRGPRQRDDQGQDRGVRGADAAKRIFGALDAPTNARVHGRPQPGQQPADRQALRGAGPRQRREAPGRVLGAQRGRARRASSSTPPRWSTSTTTSPASASARASTR